MKNKLVEKTIFKKILSLMLAFSLLFMSVMPASAIDTPSLKEEVVYGILGLDGNIKDLYVVNIFNGGAITDYGNYSDIRNLTTSEKINQNGSQITVNTTAKKFYYQGTLENKELPWNIALKYFLDGNEISGASLAGKSGKLTISMSVKPNNKINSTFFNNYALQIALLLDNKLCSNIQADNATFAEAAGKKQLTYTVLPGNDIDIKVTADVKDFEMDAISINGIKMNLDMTFDSSEFTGQISELTAAIKGLDSGAAELLDGLNQLSSGMQKYTDGMKAFTGGLGQLSSGADKLNTGTAALKNGLNEITKQNDLLLNGALVIQKATFDSVNEQLSGMKLGLPTLTPENYSAVLSSIPNLEAVKKQLDGTVQFTQGLKGYLDGVAQLSAGASDLAKGTSEFKGSASLIATSANELYTSVAELNKAIKKYEMVLLHIKLEHKSLK
ncbi:hypothetical protein EHE19_006775 [Ruminiclostridium herbifermentans]|uniref:Uncharacterized protein n=1 Tax=Ruminiclostridium herbifermentans TaxID=2488810 RepID=A0A4U7J8E6_9FIRM|nr:hypothetical protein [Ruminiclostridium herbifermentans]QNU68128.1 hypothetical protein EHE19_006775 [Ruminiclostridium herbifermentans]